MSLENHIEIIAVIFYLYFISYSFLLSLSGWIDSREMTNSFLVIAAVNIICYTLLGTFSAMRFRATCMTAALEKHWLVAEKKIVQGALTLLGVVEVINGISLWIEDG